MRIDYSRAFLKQLKKAPHDVKQAFQIRLDYFLDNPNHPLLHRHKLSGTYSNCYSLNITGDWRAVYEEKDETFETYIVFLVFGTHSQLYK